MSDFDWLWPAAAGMVGTMLFILFASMLANSNHRDKVADCIAGVHMKHGGNLVACQYVTP